ncbi:hypothetical protein CWE08_02675 [Aliidiomarina iranensis]|uniref:Outer-membrane lipoprotein LolB n=1 Tax=Aliidiomarina iranensis TaxID=1434071 RepID=A0A432W2Y9_9GAMM|nr:hypothetical protein [Aliidiomarina iranensis]RUO23568.1 hypothetical protein CWE08_02675 [Aliidiomarina iranensis]
MKQTESCYLLPLLVGVAVLSLTGCSEAPNRAESNWPEGELPTIQHQLAALTELQMSDWDGCNTDFETGQILGSQGYQNYWVCWGTTSSEHRYAFTLLAAPGNETGGQLTLEFLRGHEQGMNALIGTYLEMAGVDDADQRLRMRSDISRYLITPPDVRTMIQASMTPNRLPLDMGYNMPRSGYTTLQITARMQNSEQPEPPAHEELGEQELRQQELPAADEGEETNE